MIEVLKRTDPILVQHLTTGDPVELLFYRIRTAIPPFPANICPLVSPFVDEGVAARCDRNPKMFLAAITLAATVIFWL